MGSNNFPNALFSKQFVYPLVVLSSVALVLGMVIFMVRSMGPEMNPPQADVALERPITPLVVWLEESETISEEVNKNTYREISQKQNSKIPSKAAKWKGALKEVPLTLFDAEVGEDAQGQNLEELLKLVEINFLFLLVKADVGKEKIQDLLVILSQEPLKKVYVASPYDSSLVNLKKAESRFWYSPSPKSWVKWSLLSSFGMESIHDIKADFLFIDPKTEDFVVGALKKEVLRRNLPVIKTSKDAKNIEYN